MVDERTLERANVIAVYIAIPIGSRWVEAINALAARKVGATLMKNAGIKLQAEHGEEDESFLFIDPR